MKNTVSTKFESVNKEEKLKDAINDVFIHFQKCQDIKKDKTKKEFMKCFSESIEDLKGATFGKKDDLISPWFSITCSKLFGTDSSIVNQKSRIHNIVGCCI